MRKRLSAVAVALMLALALAFDAVAPPASALRGPTVGAARVATPAPQTAIQVRASAARPRFPQQITYTLTATSSADIVDVRLFYRPVAAEVTQLVHPDFTRGRQVTIDYVLDMTRHYLPPGIDLQFYWALTDAAGNQLETTPQQFRYQDERFAWRTKQGGQVTVLYYAGNDAFGQEILDTALRTRDRLSQSFGVSGDQPIHIVVYGSSRDFASSLPPNSAEWIGGQAHPDLGLIVTGIQPGSSATSEIGRIIPHEMSHQLLYQATKNPYGGPPHWLDEGLAVYNQETPDSSFNTMLTKAVRDGALIPVRALNSNFPLDPNQALLSYAESVSVVEFILKTYGEAKLGQLLTSFHDELAYDEALRAVLGVDTDGLDRAWKQSLGYQGDKTGAALDTGQRSGGLSGRALLVGIAAGGACLGASILTLGALVAGGLLVWRRQQARQGATHLSSR